jgi:hypothetical protein
MLETYSDEAFGEALPKRGGWRFVCQQTKAAHKGRCKNLTRCLLNPVSGLSDSVPEGTIRKQLENVRDTFARLSSNTNNKTPLVRLLMLMLHLNHHLTMLENIRRNLRDRASGLPAEGYDAIGQQMAGRLSDLVENTQKEFAPKFASFLERYKVDSQPINRFVNNLAKRVTGREEADFAQFKVDPASLADNVFASKQGVAQLVETVGPEQAENIARSYVANTLQNADAPAFQRFLSDRKTQDWLGYVSTAYSKSL